MRAVGTMRRRNEFLVSSQLSQNKRHHAVPLFGFRFTFVQGDKWQQEF
jgi:hypothetical protein